jgi:hypothetical protein
MSTDTLDTLPLDPLLDLRLDAARRGLALEGAPADLEPSLLAHFRALPRGASRPRFWWMPPLALAAVVAIASWIVRAPLAPAHEGISIETTPADAGPFLALRPLERIALEPGTRIVSTEFPRALLADWGLPVAPDRAGEPVRAEMLYSADGEPLAVRLLQ